MKRVDKESRFKIREFLTDIENEISLIKAGLQISGNGKMKDDHIDSLLATAKHFAHWFGNLPDVPHCDFCGSILKDDDSQCDCADNN